MWIHRLVITSVVLSFSAWAEAEKDVIWRTVDADGSLTIQLNSDGSCSLLVHSNALDRDTSVSCLYWVLGSRIRLRTHGQRGDEGLGKMDLEYVPQSDTVIIHGPTPRTLTRQPNPAKT